jgi:hypothetical protein
MTSTIFHIWKFGLKFASFVLLEEEAASPRQWQWRLGTMKICHVDMDCT